MKKIILLSLLPLYPSVIAQAQGGCEGSPAMGALVFTEIMADPSPSYGLPGWPTIQKNSTICMPY